jgi:hypothetical protein
MAALLITSPRPNTVFKITDEPAWPAIRFQSNATLAAGQKLTWDWKLSWGTFFNQGKEIIATANFWDAQSALFQTLTAGVITNLGGQLTVRVTGPGGTNSVTVKIIGTNPSSAAILAFLAAQPDSRGFDAILQHESGMKHFNAQGDPIKSFDNGFGICQLTSPAPTYEQVWNWKLNIVGGLALFATKRASANAYLSQGGRAFTQDQLIREAVCRWNGGAYHTWNGKAWVRPTTILCDSQTGNIGWDMTNPANTGKTEAQLRARDKGTYGSPNSPHDWQYSGVCYADRILG